MTMIIPGAARQPHTALEAGHYFQDNKGEDLAVLLVGFFASKPVDASLVSREFGA